MKDFIDCLLTFNENPITLQTQFEERLKENNIKALAAFVDFLKESGLEIKSTFSDTIITHLSKMITDYKILEANIQCELKEISVQE